MNGCLPPHLQWKAIISKYTIVSIVSNTLYPEPGPWPNQLRRGLGSQIASVASGIIGLMGVTDASVTTASFHLSIQVKSFKAHTSGVLCVRANRDRCGWGLRCWMVQCFMLTSVARGQTPTVGRSQLVKWQTPICRLFISTVIFAYKHANTSATWRQTCWARAIYFWVSSSIIIILTPNPRFGLFEVPPECSRSVL